MKIWFINMTSRIENMIYKNGKIIENNENMVYKIDRRILKIENMFNKNDKRKVRNCRSLSVFTALLKHGFHLALTSGNFLAMFSFFSFVLLYVHHQSQQM